MIELTDITICSGPFRLAHVNLTVANGSYAVLMGGTGQGKNHATGSHLWGCDRSPTEK